MAVIAAFILQLPVVTFSAFAAFASAPATTPAATTAAALARAFAVFAGIIAARGALVTFAAIFVRVSVAFACIARLASFARLARR